MSSVNTTDTHPFRLTLGDYDGIGKRYRFTNMAAAEDCACAYLGREFGETRQYSVAKFYELGPDNEWVSAGEMEF